MFSVTLSEDHLSVEPGNSATLTVGIRNTGAETDRCEIRIGGLDSDWVAIPVPSIVLAPGEERKEKVLIKPQRVAQSRAGAYPFAVIIKSLESGETAEAPGILDVEPFHLLSVEVEPKRALAGFFRKEAPFGLTTINLGNSDENLQLTADDQNDECRYQFEQDRIQLSPGQERTTPFVAEPSSVPIVGSAHLTGFTATARSVDNPIVVTSTQGTVERRALLTPALLLAVLAIFAVAAFWVAARPKPAVMDSFDADAAQVMSGGTVRLSWSASNAKSVVIETQDGPLLQGLKPNSATTLTVDKTTTFRAYAVNELGRSKLPREVTVVAKIEPRPQPAFIAEFSASPRSVHVGDTVKISYKVTNASKILLQPLSVDLPVSGLDSYDFIAEQPGSMNLTLTAYNAKNEAVSKTVTIRVTEESVAKILEFRAMVDGEPLKDREVDPLTPVSIEWHVSNAEIVKLDPGVPSASLQGGLTVAPEKTTTYTLTAIDNAGRPAVMRITVKVKKPVPPPQPPPMGPG